jgi:hypothetical protein
LPEHADGLQVLDDGLHDLVDLAETRWSSFETLGGMRRQNCLALFADDSLVVLHLRLLGVEYVAYSLELLLRGHREVDRSRESCGGEELLRVQLSKTWERILVVPPQPRRALYLEQGSLLSIMDVPVGTKRWQVLGLRSTQQPLQFYALGGYYASLIFAIWAVLGQLVVAYAQCRQLGLLICTQLIKLPFHFVVPFAPLDCRHVHELSVGFH